MWEKVLVLVFVLLQARVIDLNDDTFSLAIQDNPVVMVLFTAPWCEYCKSLIPIYEKLDNTSHNSGKSYVFAIVDGIQSNSTAEKEDIKGYPIIRLYYNSTFIDYQGEKTADDILFFINKKIAIGSVRLDTVENILGVMSSSGLRCILVTNSTWILDKYVRIAEKNEDYLFYHTSEEIIKESFPKVANDEAVLLPDYDDKEIYFEKSINELEEFLAVNMLPIVAKMDKKIIQTIFNTNHRKGVLLIRNADNPNATILDQNFREVAELLRSKDLVFISMDTQTGWNKQVANFLGIENESLPVLEIIEKGDQLLRYRNTADMTKAFMEDFILKYREGKLEQFFNSEDVPLENSEPVLKAVGKTFKSMILDNEDDVVVLFTSESCERCKKLEYVFTQLATSLKENKRLRFVKIDGNKNYIEGHTAHAYPLIKLFKGKDKASTLIYTGSKNSDDILKFIIEKASHPIDASKVKIDL